MSLTNDWLRISAIGEAHYKVNIIFKDGLIRHVRAEVTPETQEAFRQVLAPYMEWAKENRADLLREIVPEGKFIHNAENAKKFLALLRAWKESTK